jgi:hypothetical protein
VRPYSSVRLFGLALTTLFAIEASVRACTMAPPLRQEMGESDAAFALRREAQEAEATKTPEQHELELQGRLWDDSDLVFIGRYDKIRAKGKVYPSPKKQKQVRKASDKSLPPEPLEPPIFLPFYDGGEAHIVSVLTLKGTTPFQPAWYYVGGTNSCGGSNDGSLGSTFLNQDVVIFASWNDRYQLIKGKEVRSKYLDLYGIAPEDVIEPRLRPLVSGLVKAVPEE